MGTSWRNLIFLKVETDEGVTGISEATLHNREEACVAYLEAAKKRHIIGTDPFNTEDLWLRMYRNDFWRGGSVAVTAMSAVEIACWDIIGKVTNQPCYRLLGGLCRPQLKAYANGWYTVARTPEEFAKAAKGVVAKGYKAMKVDPFGAGHYELERVEKIRSIELIEAIRDAVGLEVDIFIEGHGRFSAATAIEMGKALEPFDPGWLEEPVPPENFHELKRVSDKVNIPIATGERAFTRFDYDRLFDHHAVDIIQPDVLHAGGLMEMKKISAMADAHFVVVAPHNSNGPICSAASVHFGFCTPNFKVQEIFDDFIEPEVLEAVPGYPKVVDGYVEPPTGPGLGVELNEDLIAEYPYVEGFFNLWDDEWHKRQFR
jgi:galactonate dehydratase